MVNNARIETAAELSVLLTTEEGPFCVTGSGCGDNFRPPKDSNRKLLRFSGSRVIEISPADQVAVFEAAISLDSVQQELRSHGQTLPIISMPGLTNTLSLAGSISLNLPHATEGIYGSWRDWVLGMTVVLANGQIVKCGSKAVKNVAGYDLHKLFIGARGTLSVIVEVILKTYPLAAFREVASQVSARIPNNPGETVAIQRTRRSDFEAAKAKAGQVLLEDGESSTLWFNQPNGEVSRLANDWLIQAGRLPPLSPVQQKLMAKLKQTFDPEAKLNPGEFGFL